MPGTGTVAVSSFGRSLLFLSPQTATIAPARRRRGRRLPGSFPRRGTRASPGGPRVGDVVVEPTRRNVAVLALDGHPHDPQMGRAMRFGHVEDLAEVAAQRLLHDLLELPAEGSFATLSCGCGETLHRPMSCPRSRR